ncbi:MAG: serine--tRNA ligase [Candidatus Aenigmarchaeota archaeon]|nr:serine--tRNA ligase [Candidatus Aenigmarchaeota archaeon]
MLDIKLVRENPDIIRKDLKKRNDPEKLKILEDLIKEDKKWRASLFRLEELRKHRNRITSDIAKMKKENKSFQLKIQEMKIISKEIPKLGEETNTSRENVRSALMRLPNILDKSVPIGKDETENVVIKKFGKPPKLADPKNHQEIAERIGILDMERAAKVAGNGFFYLKGGLALLERAIQSFAIDFLVKKNYVLVVPPYMLNRKAYEGVTELEAFDNVLYKIEGEDLHMIATAEHPMASMYMNEVIDVEDLPIKFIGISPCFRKEIGSHGKYTKGLFRVHNFNKIEQFVFCHPDKSWDFLKELQENAETLYQKLGLVYRVVNVCTGDIGILAAKKFDTEIWMADKEYREIGSNSNCTDYQARRLNIKFREGEGKPPAGFVHTLNNTALATSRTMVAILEQYQQKDGSVKIPRVLIPYMGGIKKLEPK